AVTVTGGRAEPVGEDMAQVRTAGGAAHLGARHAQGVVLDQLHGFGAHRLVEARPSASGLELGPTAEQLGMTGAAAVEAVALLVEQLAGPGALGRRCAEHSVLIRAEL